MQSNAKTLMTPLKDVRLKTDEGGGDGGGYKFSGYASVFGVIDSYGDVIVKGAFAEALKNAEYQVGMFFNHDSYAVPIGKWTLIKEDDHGLYVEGELTKGLALSEEVRLALLHKTVTGMSVGFSVDWDATEFDENTGGFVFNSVRQLREISLCTYPANRDAQVDEVKSLKSQLNHYRQKANEAAGKPSAGDIDEESASKLVGIISKSLI